MLLRVRNLTTDVVALDSASGLYLKPAEERQITLSVEEVEKIAPALQMLQDLVQIELEVLWDYAAELMWGDPSHYPASSGGGGSVVWRPNDPSPGSSVLSDWEDVADAIAAQGGGLVFVDSTYSGTMDISGLPVDLSRTWFIGVGATTPTIRFTGSPVPLTPIFRAKNLNVLVNTSSPLLRATAGVVGTLELVNCSITPNTSALFSTEAGSGDTSVRLVSSVVHTGGTEAFPLANGEVLQVVAVASVLETDLFSGSGDVDVRFDAESVVSGTHPSFSGSLALIRTTPSSNVQFDDSSVLPALGDYTAPARDTVQRALDFFKEDRVKSLVINRDLSGLILSVQRGTDPVLTLNRDLSGTVVSLSDGLVQKTINRDLDGQVTGVTVTVL